MSAIVSKDIRPSFWARQFGKDVTAAQYSFDAVFGLLLPLVCLILDPIVFRSDYGAPLIGPYSIAAGTAIRFGFVSLPLWQLSERAPALFTGLLLAGALFSLGLGLMLLPLSVIGLMIGIGVLGFTPLATAFVFWRNSVRAFRKARETRPPARVKILAAIGLLVAGVGPVAAQCYASSAISSATDMALSSDPETSIRGVAILKRFAVVVGLDQLISAYSKEGDPVRRERLATAYKDVTGEDIEIRLSVLND